MGSSDTSHFIFDVGKRRIRHRTTLKLNFWIDSKSMKGQIQSRPMSVPPLSDTIIKWLGSGLHLCSVILEHVKNDRTTKKNHLS